MSCTDANFSLAYDKSLGNLVDSNVLHHRSFQKIKLKPLPTFPIVMALHSSSRLNIPLYQNDPHCVTVWGTNS